MEKKDFTMLPTKKVGDIYVLVNEELGSGTSGKVYLGYHKTIDNISAVKLITKGSLDDMKTKTLSREIEALQKGVNHKNIVKLYELAQTTNTYYICLEYCKNGSLKNYLAGKEATTELVLKIARDIFEGFRFLDKNSIIHRDIKPENLLVDEQGNIKIADFGFSKTLDQKDKAAAHTFLGTPVYASYEVINHLPYSSKCDVYSVGVVLFEIAFDCHPMFPKEKPKSFRQIVDKFNENPEIEFPSKPLLSDNFKSLIKGMLKVKEKDRISWTDVFNYFDKENMLLENETLLNPHKKKLDKALFYDFAAKTIQDAIKNDTDQPIVKLLLLRTEFLAINFLSLALIEVKNEFNECSVLFPDFASNIISHLKEAEKWYQEIFKNICLIELNKRLKLHKTDPEKNDPLQLNKMLKDNINDLSALLKNESKYEPNIKKVLLCLEMLKSHPKISDEARKFVEDNESKSPMEINKIIYN